MVAFMKNLRTAAAVVDAIGIDRVCKLTRTNPKVAWHWYGRAGAFPPRTYVVLQRALKERGFEAPPKLWKMVA